MWPILLVIEMVGHVTKCFALCVRLLANMNSGHILLAVLLLFAEGARGWNILIVALPTGLGLIAMMFLELLVAVIQAFIFTFLTGLFISLAVSPQH
jgi:F-type H+-transporting ATPase subunit a